MESRLSETTRWCRSVMTVGFPSSGGYPTAEHEQLADQGRVILAGCVVEGMRPSHICTNRACEFIATDRIYQREHAGSDVYGVGVWPHGRRSVRIEANDQVWTVMIAGKGSMLIDRHALMVIPHDVFENMWPWEVEGWASRRGFGIETRPADEGWSLELGEGGGFFELVLIKTWWRSLGRDPVEAAIERLSCEVSSPIWLPE